MQRALGGGMTVVQADAVVIGAGAGGLCAAARLSQAGLHTIVVDDKDRLGGRASTEQIDGFTVNIGAIAIELGGCSRRPSLPSALPLISARRNPQVPSSSMAS